MSQGGNYLSQGTNLLPIKRLLLLPIPEDIIIFNHETIIIFNRNVSLGETTFPKEPTFSPSRGSFCSSKETNLLGKFHLLPTRKFLLFPRENYPWGTRLFPVGKLT
jgi:hypothetical protein